MKTADHIISQLEQRKFDKLFLNLYGESMQDPQSMEAMYERYQNLIRTHKDLFFPDTTTSGISHDDAEAEEKSRSNTLTAENAVSIFSTPGRTELGGNHTDHNHGRVLAGSINLDTIAAVNKRNDKRIIIDSEGYPRVEVDISDTQVRASEKNSTEALVRGIAAYLTDLGAELGGFQANTTSRVLKGSGLSSSAAVEVLIGTIWNSLYCEDRFSPVELAKAGQFAENTYFGKPSGLMDQTACAEGGIVGIDFLNPNEPVLEPISIRFSDYGYTLVVIDTGGNHANLTPEYAAIPEEMKQTAALFGQEVCRGISIDELSSKIQDIRSTCGDRAFLRAYHFIKEDQRVPQQIQALREKKIEEYLKMVRDSGKSSIRYLQNIYPAPLPKEQGISIALALTEDFIENHGGKGAARVHGGGFAGTIQVYIPTEHFKEYQEEMNSVFGKGSTTKLSIRSKPTMQIIA
ncbi:MAG: galactokinase [Spirochaetia bacterium]|nr:galactokinase [Spirochaetia bacterium]